MSAPTTRPTTAQRDLLSSILTADAPADVSTSGPSATPRAGEIYPQTAEALVRRGLARFVPRAYGQAIALTGEGERVATEHIARGLSGSQIEALRRCVAAREASSTGVVPYGLGAVGTAPSAPTVESLRTRALVETNAQHGQAMPSYWLTRLGHEVYQAVGLDNVSAAQATEATRVEREAREAADRASLVETYEPALGDCYPAPSAAEPQRIAEPVEEPRYTERLTPGISDAVRGHIELAARLDELEGLQEGAVRRSDLVSLGGRIAELEQVMATLVACGAIKEPVPTTDDELEALALAERRPVRVGERIHEDGSETDCELLVGAWRRDLLAYVGGGEFVPTERGTRALRQAKRARRAR